MLTVLFQSVPDHRVVNRCTYRLDELLTIALLTYLCGGEDYADMEAFAETRARQWGLLQDNTTSPSYDTFERLMKSVEPQRDRTLFHHVRKAVFRQRLRETNSHRRKETAWRTARLKRDGGGLYTQCVCQ